MFILGLLGLFLTINNYVSRNIPLVLPSALEQWQTASRDPAFYLIWKRVLNIFKIWQEHLPMYRYLF